MTNVCNKKYVTIKYVRYKVPTYGQICVSLQLVCFKMYVRKITYKKYVGGKFRFGRIKYIKCRLDTYSKVILA